MKIPNGTIIEKINSIPGEDAHQDGARGKVVYVMGPMPEDGSELAGRYAYFVVWDDMPGIPVGVSDTRIRPVEL